MVMNEKCRIYWNYKFSRIVRIEHSRSDIVFFLFRETNYIFELILASDEQQQYSQEKRKVEEVSIPYKGVEGNARKILALNDCPCNR